MNRAKVSGQRSPRWAFNATMAIPCKDGIPYLFRRRLIQTPLFGIYLHDIFEPDADRHPHDHPWTFYSIVLRGRYTERLHPIPHILPTVSFQQTWRRWSIHRMGRETAHRIVRAEPGLKTLIFVGRRRKSGWGFFTEHGWMSWQDYEKEYQTPPVEGS